VFVVQVIKYYSYLCYLLHEVQVFTCQNSAGPSKMISSWILPSDPKISRRSSRASTGASDTETKLSTVLVLIHFPHSACHEESRHEFMIYRRHNVKPPSRVVHKPTAWLLTCTSHVLIICLSFVAEEESVSPLRCPCCM